jgi:hypothetical protein
MSPYVYSVLLPFKTPPVKPAYDYPMNTSIVETTYEFNLTATAGSATYPIPSGGYGIAVSILPHAFNSFTSATGVVY